MTDLELCTCLYCDKVHKEQIRVCDRCYTARYCDIDCQIKDFVGHEFECIHT